MAVQQQNGDTGISPQDAIEVFGQISDLVKDWRRPDEITMPAGGHGAWMAIRWGGRIMGQSADLHWALEPQVSAACLARVVRLAMDRAEVTAQGSQGDAVERDDRLQRFLSSPTTVELQIARTPRRISARGLRDLSARIRPGLDGVIVEAGGKRAGMFPGQYLADGLNPSQVLFKLSSDLSLKLEQMDQQLESGAARVWLFQVEHLAQPRRGDPPTFLYRGSHLVPVDKVSVASLTAFAGQIVEHLLTRRFAVASEVGNRSAALTDGLPKEPIRLLGKYEPELDVYQTFEATVHEQVLCAYVLARYARLKGHNVSLRAAARGFAGELVTARIDALLADPVEASAETVPEELNAGDAGLLALAIDALDDQAFGVAPDRVALARAKAMRAVQSIIHPSLGLRADVPPEDLAICALVMKSAAVNQAVWDTVEDDLDTSLMPWMVLAELAVDRGAEQAAQETFASLRRIADTVWLRQVSAEQAQMLGLDTSGGLVLGMDRGSGTPIPDWTTARWLGALSAMASDTGVIDSHAQQLLYISRLSFAARFLMQLSVRESDGYCLANPARAVGGIRAEVSNWALSPEPSAVTLLGVVELLEGMAEIGQDSAVDAGSG